MKDRVRKLNDAGANAAGEFVLYWSQMNRRVDINHALSFAVELANEHGVPVLFYEGLTCTYKQANDRMHTFLLEGVPDTHAACEELGIGYAFYLRRTKASANDVVYRMAHRALAVVTDDYPAFIAADHNARVPGRIGVAYYAVDSSCIVPMSRHTKREHAAYTIRPKITKLLGEYMCPLPLPKPKRKWIAPQPEWHVDVTRDNIPALVGSCDIDHSVKPSNSFRGGSVEARRRLDEFLRNCLHRYAEARNEPSEHATSNMSPYLHFGHISSLDVALSARDYANAHKLIADEFLEELIVRRELAFNFARFSINKEGFEDLPDWARKTMDDHRDDPRDPLYSNGQMERAATADPLWNATQNELLARGKIHGYYRMYWGKKIIEWSATYSEAHRFMLDMHDRYALDGRDPNTYTNVLWCFGLHDRPWPERPIFGKIRFMSFDGMKRKTDIHSYIEEIDGRAAQSSLPFVSPA